MDISLLKSVIWTLLEEKPLAPAHKDHPLVVNYADFRECHILPDWLPIYAVDKVWPILAASRTGTHYDLFDKKATEATRITSPHRLAWRFLPAQACFPPKICSALPRKNHASAVIGEGVVWQGRCQGIFPGPPLFSQRGPLPALRDSFSVVALLCYGKRTHSPDRTETRSKPQCSRFFPSQQSLTGQASPQKGLLIKVQPLHSICSR